MIRRYSEMLQFTTFKERFEYLKLTAGVGEDTFGFDRYLNQQFYGSKEWRALRDTIIVRDNGMDLGVDGVPIKGKMIIHHMNPLAKEDILDLTDYVLNPEYLITVSQETHNAIHYGNFENVKTKGELEVRTPKDTCLWR